LLIRNLNSFSPLLKDEYVSRTFLNKGCPALAAVKPVETNLLNSHPITTAFSRYGLISPIGTISVSKYIPPSS
jgi:hypothetical protein